MADRMARGLPTCGHIREDGLGVCAAGPEELVHHTGNLHGHPFKAVLEVKAEVKS